ncbi:hypothetical protein EOL73_01740 [Candidatus Saccharibacteria bacterium]|nr:hypothetical protein [Candidatus Saccharibacteria bacterium]NCU40458.1 hypothetical protein [Candidatus Saccharibacteria bacterium]
MQVEQPPKQQIVDRIKKASNILVTVNRNPNVDLLVSALALTLMLEKMDKSAVAVFSGVIPRAIDFLEPDKIIEDNVDSLRDFIIALDKEKADRLRYKVEGDEVRVYITPYKTTISEQDLKFSQGDFNVDLIVGLGVEKSDDLDKALTSYGRILHDAQIVTINTHDEHSSIGDVDWSDASANSYSEMIMSMSEALQSGLLDQPIATSLLTGIVSSTDRFRNEKTSAKVMTMAAQLMAAGANQQLIAEQLDKDSSPAANTPPVNNIPNPSEISLRSTKPAPVAETVDLKQPQPVITEKDTESVTSELDNSIEQKSSSNDVIEDLASETERMNEQSSFVPDLSLPPLPNTPAENTQPGGWRDLSVARTLDNEQPTEQPSTTQQKSRPDSKVILNHEGDSVADIPQLNTSPINSTFGGNQDMPSVNTISGEPANQSTTTNSPKVAQTNTPGLSFEMPPLPNDGPVVEVPEPEPKPEPVETAISNQPSSPLPVFDAPSANVQDPAIVEQPTAPSALDTARSTLSSIFNDTSSVPPAPPVASAPTPATPTPQPDPNANITSPTSQIPNLPMPDFSTLPPLPGEIASQSPPQPNTSTPPQLGLPTPPAPTTVAPNDDPAEFRLPS